MLEVALEHVQSYCEKNDLNIVGYYEIPSLVRPEASLSPFAQRIGDKISVNNSGASILLTMHNYTGELRSWTKSKSEDGWVSGVASSTKNNGDVKQRLCSESEADKFDSIVEGTIAKKLHFEIKDFDLWLDNPADNDFTNFHIENLLSMFTQEC